MDDSRFDRLTRIFATSTTRRVVTGALAGSILAALQGASAEDAAGKKRRKKKKKPKPSACTPSCFNKVCGANNGCGGTCTVQAGCDSDEACVDGACDANACDPPCTGNHVCQPNGSCTCPQGLKECQGPGLGGNCHECCQDPFGGGGDEDCEGHLQGAYCQDQNNDGELFLQCGCFSAATTCPNGQCGTCCRLQDCFADVFGTGPVDSGRDCVVVNQATGELGCKCRSGTIQCPNFTFCAESGNRRACGDDCEWCGFRHEYEPFYVCVGNPQRCCLPTGALCALANNDCCAGVTACTLNQQLGTFTCA